MGTDDSFVVLLLFFYIVWVHGISHHRAKAEVQSGLMAKAFPHGDARLPPAPTQDLRKNSLHKAVLGPLFANSNSKNSKGK